jgi:hypothetical protein
MTAHQERARGLALPPIPEAPECSGQRKWESGPASSERTEAMQAANQATTPRKRESSGAERAAGAAQHAAERAAKRTVNERKLPAWRSVKEWPADREAFGRLTLRGSADQQAGGTRAVCRIRGGVLTLGIEQRAAAGEEAEEEVAELPVEALAVGLQRGRAHMLTLATIYKNEMFDEIYCFCDDPVRRNKWIAVFRRMGVAIYDLRD